MTEEDQVDGNEDDEALQSEHERPIASDQEGHPPRNPDGDTPRSREIARAEAASQDNGPDGSRLDERRSEFADVHDGGQPELPGIEVQGVFHQGPLPPPQLLAEYERAHPGLADRIVRMAEDSLQAEIDSDMVPIRAEARALLSATIAVAFLPWVILIAALALLIAGYETAGVIAGAAGLISAGPQVIQSARLPHRGASRDQRRRQSGSDSSQRDA